MKKLSKEIEFNFFLKLVRILGFSQSIPAAHNSRRKSSRGTGREKESDMVARKKARIEEEEQEGEGEGEGEEGEEGEGKWEDELEEEGEEEEEEEEGKEGEERIEEEEIEDSNSDIESEIDWEGLPLRVQTDRYEVCMDEDKRQFREPFLKVLVACLSLLHTHKVYQVRWDKKLQHCIYHQVHVYTVYTCTCMCLYMYV